MDEHVEKTGLKHLENIEQDLDEIKEHTPTSRHAFTYGLWQGAGALIGGILALTLLGWVLSFFGIIPGLAVISHYFQNIVGNFRR